MKRALTNPILAGPDLTNSLRTLTETSPGNPNSWFRAGVEELPLSGFIVYWNSYTDPLHSAGQQGFYSVRVRMDD